MSQRPLIGITCNIDEKDVKVRRAYIDAVTRAGGTPILLPPPADDPAPFAKHYVEICHAIVFTGGDDPSTARYNQPMHPAAKLVDARRQAFEEALLSELDRQASKPVLGICLGMQMMALHAGGILNQHLPDTTPTHADHTGDHRHTVQPTAATGKLRLPAQGSVASWHHQAVLNPGRLRTIALAHDGVIEAIDDPSRPFYAGVQWHPERTPDESVGIELFRQLIAAAKSLA